MRKSAPFNNLDEISLRKEQLKKDIHAQENVLANDFDAYQEDVDTFKKIWNSAVGIRRFTQNGIVSNISKLASNHSTLSTFLTIGTKVFQFLWNRRKRK